MPRVPMKPLILTTGEPAGVGPDLCVQLADYLQSQNVVLCGDIHLLRQRAKRHGKTVNFQPYDAMPASDTVLPVLHTPLNNPVTAGVLDVANADYVISTLTLAADGTVNGDFSGIVTAPIHKGIICEAGGKHRHFSGHTEFFAEQTQTPRPIMVLGTEQLKVGLVTTHLALADVPHAITATTLSEVLIGIDHDMRRYFTSGRTPRIGVCGLNPHAGESGHMGREEIDIINPTLQQLRERGLDVSDALPADTLFVPHHAEPYDIIVAMYHDQGLPVIKAQGFGACVNMTFGLPIIRTSVDHGTALDLAGSDKADPNSLRCAVEMAKQMAEQSQ